MSFSFKLCYNLFTCIYIVSGYAYRYYSCRELYKDEAYGTKKRIFALKSILGRETDDTHGITMERILQILKNEYGIEAERKSIYDDLNVLRDSEILEVSPPQGKNANILLPTAHFSFPKSK